MEEILDDRIEQADTMYGRFLTFTLGEEIFGIGISCVTEIIGIQPVNSIPEVPEYIRGIINLRGKIIPVIDMRLKLKKQAVDFTDRTCIIVIETQQFMVGLIVDEVAEVLTIGDSDIVPPPEIWAGSGNKYLNGIGKSDGKVALLLDCEKLFSDDSADALK